jgi:hypothetical protein
MKILNIVDSPIKNKRFRALLDNGDKIDFGLKGGATYIDHGDKESRRNYWLRHYGNKVEKKLIDGMIPSPALLSAYILWGDSKSLNSNLSTLNYLLKMYNDKK